MFGVTRWSPIDDVFNFQREVDRLFHQFWSDLPTRSASGRSASFQVNASDDAWRIDVPLPGVDPRNVHLEVAGNSLTIRAEEPGDKGAPALRYQQTFTAPHFLDLDKISASHRHGMLQLTLPLKDSVKPRRIEIEGVTQDRKQIAAA